VKNYLERVNGVLLGLPLVVTEAGIQEWLARLEDLERGDRRLARRGPACEGKLVMNRDMVPELWDEHVAWSKAASDLREQRSFWRTTVLVLTVSGATLQTIAATMPTFKLAAGGTGTVALALVPIFARYFLTSEQAAKWLRARSISEGIKSEIYTYCAGVEPYTGPGASETLLKKVRAIRQFGANLERERAKAGSPTKPAPPALDADGYISRRVRQQIDEYYRPAAKKNAELAERYRWIEMVSPAWQPF
jgi:hypothetical protein